MRRIQICEQFGHDSTIDTVELNIKDIGSARELKEGFLQIWRERSGGEHDDRHEANLARQVPSHQHTRQEQAAYREYDTIFISCVSAGEQCLRLDSITSVDPKKR